MKQYKKWLVGLDYSLIDKAVIEYTAFLAGILKPEKIYFFNVQKDFDIPDSVKAKFPELRRPIDEKLTAMMKEDVENNFNKHEHFDIEYKVVEGNPFDELLKWSRVKNVDLFIAGRKKELKGSGVLPQRIARKAPTSVLFVPEKPVFRIQEIFVPVDFSDNSKIALEKGISLAKVDDSSSVHVHHVYHLPYSYGKTRLERDYSQILREEAAIQYNELISKINIDGVHVNPAFHYDSQDRVAEVIIENLQKKNADILIVGCKGKSAALSFLMGSITEKIIRLEDSIPVLVVKAPEAE